MTTFRVVRVVRFHTFISKCSNSVHKNVIDHYLGGTPRWEQTAVEAGEIHINFSTTMV